MSIDNVIRDIPEGWFIEAMGEKVKRVIFAGDKHEHICFYAKLQHRSCGMLITCESDHSIANALSQALIFADTQQV